MEGLFERTDELESLRVALEQASNGRGALVIVEGPAGIGKTTLLSAARELASEAGVVSLTARGGELERDFPYGVVRQLFEGEVASAAPAVREKLLADVAGLAAPVFGLENPAAPEGSADPAFAALHGLYWLLVNLSTDRPLLVVVDDAHWADRASLRFMAYLLPRLEELAVLVLVATRPEEPGTELDLLRQLAAGPGVSFIRPGPLGPAATARLIESALGAIPSPVFLSACHSATGGNPFLLSELAASLVADGIEPSDEAAARVAQLGPEAVSRSVLLRLARLSADAPSLARAVAVLGEHGEVRNAAALAGIASSRASSVADELAQVGLFEVGRPLRFAHPILRSAVYRDIPAGERAALHGQAAHVLAASGASPDAIGMHLLNVEPAGDPDVADTLVSAACAVVERGAPELAIRLIDRALAEPPARELRAEALYVRGQAEAAASRPECIDSLRAALDESTGAETKARIAIELAQVMVIADRQEEVVPVLERLVPEIGRDDPTLGRRVEAELVTTAGLHYATNQVAVDRLMEIGPMLLAQSPAEDTLGDRLLLANISFGLAATGMAPAETVVDLSRRAIGEELPPPDTWFAFGMSLLARAYADHSEEALAWFGRAAEAARDSGSLLLGMISCWASNIAYRAGHVARAETDARAAIELGHLSDWGAVNCERCFLADALLERGLPDEAEHVLAERDLLGGLPPLVQANFIIETRGRVRLAQGRNEEALEDFLRCGENLEPAGTRNPALCAWRSQAALACLRLGRKDDASRYVREEVELARAFGAPRAIGIALRVSGLVKGDDPGIADLREAVEVLAPSDARLEYARALVDLGAAIRRSGEGRGAREPLLHGADLARRCGATALVERAHDELKASGARPRRLALSGVAALTGSERRVSELAAEGLTNKAIAQTLFVTLRTVEMHLSNAYRKLDIGSRDELAAALESDSADLSLSA